MVGLWLDDLTVAGVCASLSLDVPVGTIRAAVVRDQQSVVELLRVVVGLDKPAGGRVLVQGVDVREQREDHEDRRLHRVGGHDDQCWVREVAASGGLAPDLTLVQHLSRGQCPTTQIPKSEATQRARKIASLLGLRPFLRRYPDQLTASERQLAGLAFALCWRPCAIVLEDSPDAPTWDTTLEAERRRLNRDGPDTATLLADVSTLVITTDPARIRHLDPDPVGVDPPDERGGGHG
jgi:ABC-type polar amino acid transport system ATPase subunit